MKIVLLGAPGVGKGTQADVICGRLGIPAVSTGNILREAIKSGSELGIKAKSFIDAGQLVPDDIVIGIIAGRLKEDDCKNGFILDGFPRTVAQAEALEKMGIEIDKVIEISVADEEIINRLSGRRVCPGCGASYHLEYNPPAGEGICDKCEEKLAVRTDDEPGTLKGRLEVYYRQTVPVREHYSKKGKLRTVLGQKEVKDTSKLTIEALER